MGNRTVLAEALSEDQHDLLVSLMKVTMIMWHPIYKLNIQCSCDISKEAEKLFADPVLSYWWSGLQDPDNDGVWTWMYCELSPTSTEWFTDHHDGSVSVAGVSVPPGWSNWNPVAVPGPENGLDCMQFLSGTALGQFIYCVTEVQSK